MTSPHSSPGPPTGNRPRYQYAPLEPRQIRTLLLLPAASRAAPLRAHLVTRTLDLRVSSTTSQESGAQHRPSHSGYEALSYVWGTTDPDNLEEVEVLHEDPQTSTSLNRQVTAGTIQIRPNLAAALRELRTPASPRTLWADSICINQLDLDERSAQVSLMGDIYKLAERVIVWLGEASSDSDVAMRLLDRLGRAVEVNYKTGRYRPAMEVELSDGWRKYLSEDGAPHPFSEAEMKAVASLLRNEWFRRLWVWQEVTLGGERAMVRFGHQEMPWSVLVHAISVLTNDTHAHPPRLGRKELDRYAADAAHIRVMALSPGNMGTPLATVLRSKFCECADQRDRVYAILNMQSWDNFRDMITPDYAASQMEVFKQFCLAYYDVCGGLGFLQMCHAGNTLRDDGEPTWVPDLSSLQHHPFPRGHALASGTTRGSLVRVEGSNGCKIRVQAVACGTIVEAGLSSVVPVGGPGVGHDVDAVVECVTSLALQLLGELGSPAWHSERAPNLMSALLAGRTDASVGTALDVLEYWVSQAAGSPSRSFHGPTARTSDEMEILGALGYSFVGRACHQTDHGSFVIGTDAALAGDKLFVILGCPNPMLLRLVEGSQNSYQIVGHCLHPGYMNGEALLGPLPEGWEASYQHGIPIPLYTLMDEQGQKEIQQTWEDPRLQMPKGWTASPIGQDGYVRWYPIAREGDVASHTIQHPAASIEALRVRGVPIDEIILV
ncbi:heterokaryon incompatibility protein-domain-containing protein [Podospora aff. communis PSN243]|uniref:Heterokaryon incompatibility protein-domain-containing protein n=1 Tax=Podospora aff. communis PSN243 TaxID=3040156 RepID=A0AAV9GRN0_9PEZI|nr:heterokaryon incompatibility protein-domain-containing protein [Podospora aff. communis PSN243]